jgi:hypothetical protein
VVDGSSPSVITVIAKAVKQCDLIQWKKIIVTR